ncbi:hypothetical protein [Parasulfitobacter algicola]|uniref:Uncharacterized protein n=1 Tax=Parasulfitobacter algicola TaxID=2614809 RepID=A0ABX2IKA7_9RHOB|nr:hypothetical protein [Sulfitobacter algicola]NSX53283.1 hypothetical protein [Sulfitobacter algicola]
MTEEEKIREVMIKLVENGIYDLESFAEDLASKLSDNWDPSIEGGGELVGGWYVLREGN